MFRNLVTFRSVAISLAMILAAAAALKLHLLLTEQFADVQTGSSFPFLWSSLFLEVGVVWLLFSKQSDGLKWLGVFGLFCVLTSVSLFNVLAGKASCGCAGVLEIPTSLFLVLDLATLSLLLCTRPKSQSAGPLYVNEMTKENAGIVTGVCCAGLLLLVLQIPSIDSSLRSLISSNDIENIALKMGKLQRGVPIAYDLCLKNNAVDDVMILGVTTSCTCAFPQEIIGSEIPQKGQITVKIKVKPETSGRFHQRIVFYLDSPRQHAVSADLFASVDWFFVPQFLKG